MHPISGFTLHDQNSAAEAASPLLKQSQQAFGMISGRHGVMAEAPGLLEGYQVLHGLFVSSSFSADEKTVVWQTVKNVLEVILGLSRKIMGNYTNHIARTPVDEPFERFAWSKKQS
nr:hypothetical protein [Pseudomonas lalucatii]